MPQDGPIAIGTSVHNVLIFIAHPMPSVILPPRGQCTEVTDNLQLCQCLSFASTLDQHICGQRGHGIHAHCDYVSMFVYHCPMMNCTAYFPKTARVQAYTCSASLIEHISAMNAYRLPPLPYGAGTHPSSVIPSTGGTANTPFTPVLMSATSTNDNPSQSYGDGLVITPTIVTATTQIDAHSHLEVENSYIAQYQNDNFGVMHNIQASNTRFHEDYPTTYPVLGPEAWADHHPSADPSSPGV
ncbi:hypothetical protein IW261DRAFT_930277 [Armillaria novae-zelandiae]|uniref:Uncharacterized protein n=1 Tax=Armillaria novae-zelandiae TaxID=153914 RepID=A0AA39UDV0_9AGAR|nr:hypothetical protein IW261DRAFT_930277 [Armillaria novae-zelandiae]